MVEPTKLILDAGLDIEGSEDTTQLEVRGHSQQAAPLQEWQENGGDTLVSVSGDGRLLVGDVDLETPAALVEVSQDVTLPSALPQRGLSVLGRLSGAVTGAIDWVAHELQLVGSGGVSGLHAALRAALVLENSGDASLAELRAGDFEAENRAGTSQAPVGKMAGLRSTVIGEDGSTLDEAVALEASVQQETGGVINTAYGLKVEDMPAAAQGSYAIHTGQGAVHLGDYLEMAEMSAPGTPDAGLVRLYPKADGHLYARDDQGNEYDLVDNGGSAIAVQENGTEVVAAADTLDFKDFNVEDLGGGGATVYHNLPGVFDGRLTLEMGVPVSTTDQTTKTLVYLTPYKGDRISLYDGTRWKVHTLGEISIKLTDAQNGTLTNGNVTVTGLTDTSQLIAGMEVSGTGVPANTTISSIDGASQVTLNQNATASGAQSLTFKVAANKNLDLFVFSNAGAPKLEMAAWTSDTARAAALATQNGIYVKSGASTRRYVGTIRTTSVIGQCEDSFQRRLLWNYCNRQCRKLTKTEQTNSWTYGTQTWRPANNSTSNRVEIVVGIQEAPISLLATTVTGTNVAAYYGITGIGEDTTTGNSATGVYDGVIASNVPTTSGYGTTVSIVSKYPTIGFHYYQWVEIAQSGATITFYSKSSDLRQGGLAGYVEG